MSLQGALNLAGWVVLIIGFCVSWLAWALNERGIWPGPAHIAATGCFAIGTAIFAVSLLS